MARSRCFGAYSPGRTGIVNVNVEPIPSAGSISSHAIALGGSPRVGRRSSSAATGSTEDPFGSLLPVPGSHKAAPPGAAEAGRWGAAEDREARVGWGDGACKILRSFPYGNSSGVLWLPQI